MNIVFTTPAKLEKLQAMLPNKMAPEWIYPGHAYRGSNINLLEKMANNTTRSCTSINLSSIKPLTPEINKDVNTIKVIPYHFFDDEIILSNLDAFLNKCFNLINNIKSAVIFGSKQMPNKPSEKIFDTILERLSKEKEITYFKNHHLDYGLETNAFYTNMNDTLYLAPKSVFNIKIPINNESDLNNIYQTHHIAKGDNLSFEV